MNNTDQPSGDTTSETEPDPKAEEKTSAWRVMLGLTVIWGSLYLVAIAQKISYDESNGYRARQTEIDPNGGRSTGVQLADMTPQLDSMIESLEVQSIPARQIVKKLLYDAHLFAQPKALDKIPEYPISLSLEDVPLHVALSRAVGAVDMGFYLREDSVGFFERTVSQDRLIEEGAVVLKWQADIDLVSAWTTLFAVEGSDIQIDLKVHSLESAGGTRARDIEFKIMRNNELLGSGIKNLLVTATEPVKIQPIPETNLHIGNPSEDLGDDVFNVTFIYQSMEPPDQAD